MRFLRTLSLGAAALALCCLSLPASALEGAGEAVTPRWKTTVKVGAFLPSQGVMRNLTTSAWHFVGVDVDPGFRYKPANGVVSLAAEVAFRDVEDGAYFTAPFLVKAAWDLPTSGDKSTLYWGVGVGSYISNTAYRAMVVKPGLQLLIGAKLGPNGRLEGAYDYVGRYTDRAGNGISQNGFKVSLGVRL
ncbi:MAG: hypothetical protein NT029_13580 [Armatimonadetes bacterium]|nr:hypothetical protein [Armatimonadota bacterium]